MTKNDGQPSVLRWPSLRQPLDLLFLFTCLLLAADVLVPEIFGNGKTKDYALWYWAGRQVLEGATSICARPAARWISSIRRCRRCCWRSPSFFGKIPLYLTLSSPQLGSMGDHQPAQQCDGRLVANPRPWLMALPGFATITFVFDQYDLGQPNLVLLALMLPASGGYRTGRGSAAACSRWRRRSRCFRWRCLPYLLWRRRWAAAASMIACTLLLLYVVPAPVRGFDRNAAEFKTWFSRHGRLQFGKGFWPARRAELVVGQSVADRRDAPAVRPINYYLDEPQRRSRLP